ncbi:MAG: hypothetical protein U5J63_01265 [Fodinibius sp.]|nr:hypothetical protein [Fodinibius sp.]
MPFSKSSNGLPALFWHGSEYSLVAFPTVSPAPSPLTVSYLPVWRWRRGNLF